LAADQRSSTCGLPTWPTSVLHTCDSTYMQPTWRLSYGVFIKASSTHTLRAVLFVLCQCFSSCIPQFKMQEEPRCCYWLPWVLAWGKNRHHSVKQNLILYTMHACMHACSSCCILIWYGW
jgi:hypothetical protein